MSLPAFAAAAPLLLGDPAYAAPAAVNRLSPPLLGEIANSHVVLLNMHDVVYRQGNQL